VIENNYNLNFLVGFNVSIVIFSIISMGIVDGDGQDMRHAGE
jgi:hypothetical protein